MHKLHLILGLFPKEQQVQVQCEGEASPGDQCPVVALLVLNNAAGSCYGVRP